jgi:hypothetical protein
MKKLCNLNKEEMSMKKAKKTLAKKQTAKTKAPKGAAKSKKMGWSGSCGTC